MLQKRALAVVSAYGLGLPPTRIFLLFGGVGVVDDAVFPLSPGNRLFFVSASDGSQDPVFWVLKLAGPPFLGVVLTFFERGLLCIAAILFSLVAFFVLS